MIIVITDVAMLVAAKNFVSPKLPINAVSTKPTKGIERLEKKTGMDSKKILFLELLAELLVKFIRKKEYTLKYLIIKLYTLS
jgi:hypothetical protein